MSVRARLPGREERQVEQEHSAQFAARQEPQLRIVAIGASAGGLEALHAFFGATPPDTGIAWVVVVHLSPEHESHFAERLQPACPMPVQQVTSTTGLEPNHVYVIPPNANLNSIDSHVRLSDLPQSRQDRAPIDHFLRTLARAHDGSAIGVILSGAGSDGSLGLRRIKESGGLTIAQDPADAEHDAMPRSAIATGMVDLIAEARTIPALIVRYCGTEPRLPKPDANDEVDKVSEVALQEILAALTSRSGREFTALRRGPLLRRIAKRMRIRQVETLQAYLRTLRQKSDEADLLERDLLFNVAEFFCDEALAENLQQRVLPTLFDLKLEPTDRLRVWFIGCSTGEEAYSLAMLLLEAVSDRDVKPGLQVFATDVSDAALQRAREGVYPQEIAATVSNERLARFFVRQSGHYRIRNEVRDLVVFAGHDLLREPPYSHIDLIVCRGVLRDLQPPVRKGVLGLFYYALEPHGMLLLDKDEDVDAPHLFVKLAPQAQLFRRTSGPRQHIPLPPTVRAFKRDSRLGRRRGNDAPPTAGIDMAAIHRKAIEEHSAPSVLANARNQVVHYSRSAGRYLRMPGGEPTQDIFKLVRDPLHSQLRTALDIVRRTGERWRSMWMPIPGDGMRQVAVRVEAVASAEMAGLLLVMFEERRSPLIEAASGGSEQVLRLEDDLEQTNRQLRALISAHESDQDRLTSTNQTLHSANDELSTTLQELESSKEELQVLNEELKTLDEENQRRLQELAQITADLEHLLESTGIAMLFLDRQLRIVRFTPQLGELFNILHTDIGRPLRDLAHGLDYDRFEADSRHVLGTLAPVDVEVSGREGQWYLMRILPYRPRAEAVDGVVVALIDITERKHAEDLLRLADRRKDEFLALLAHELRNPLAPISSGVEILKLAGDDPRMVSKVAATMGRQTKQLVRLVDDLLEVSRISGGKLRLQKSFVRLADIIRDAIAAIRPLVDQGGHELTVRAPEEPIVLEADAARLTQVIANLLSNAARYTPNGGQLTITVAREASDAVISVRDTGIGISHDALDHVFDMFYQGASERREAGLGIGLTLAKSLVEMHGGTIEARSDGENCGSEFTVRLPVSKAHAPAAPSPAQDKLVDHRVLIIDDNVDAAETLSVLLRAMGDKDVHVANSGSRGLELAATLRPAIVLLDLMMPGMDGYEVARRLRSEEWGENIFLVALTGWAQEDHKRRAREAGFDRHLAKPIDRRMIEDVLNEPRLMAQKSA